MTDCKPRWQVEGCVSGPRPCMRQWCRYHLGRDEEPTCALDVAATGPSTHQEIGNLLGVTRQRIHQIETRALGKLQDRMQAMGITADAALYATQPRVDRYDTAPSDPLEGERGASGKFLEQVRAAVKRLGVPPRYWRDDIGWIAKSDDIF